jgi:hypothetical protein
MATKMNKLDRMAVAGETLADEGLEDAKDAIQDVLQHLETFEENREQAIGSFGEATSFHEDRQWEDRDSALEEADNAITEMTSALDEIEMQSEWVSLPEGRLEKLRKTVTEVEEHLGFLR